MQMCVTAGNGVTKRCVCVFSCILAAAYMENQYLSILLEGAAGNLANNLLWQCLTFKLVLLFHTEKQKTGFKDF